MKKRTSFVVEESLLDQASAVLGTKTASQTIRESLERTVRQAHLDKLAAWELPESFAEDLAVMRAPRVLNSE